MLANERLDRSQGLHLPDREVHLILAGLPREHPSMSPQNSFLQNQGLATISLSPTQNRAMQSASRPHGTPLAVKRSGNGTKGLRTTLFTQSCLQRVTATGEKGTTCCNCCQDGGFHPGAESLPSALLMPFTPLCQDPGSKAV